MSPVVSRTLILIGTMVLAFLASRRLVQPPEAVAEAAEETVLKRPSPKDPTPSPRRSGRELAPAETSDFPEGAIAGEVTLSFADEDALEDFLSSIAGRSDIRVLGRIDRLGILRLGIRSFSSISDLYEKDQLGFNYVALQPNPQPGVVQAGAVGFGATLLDFLGIADRPLEWGQGVKVAVIDSGVVDHPNFKTTITRLDLRRPQDQLGETNGHGTAVASIIAGANAQAPGIAPSTDILSIAVTGESGSTDTFTLAEAFVAAVDEGVDFINISMGTFGDSLALQRAVEYANANGVVIVAPTGNEAIEVVAFPAAYPGVVAVGAVDANATHLQFSNIGPQVDIAAPGYEVSAAYPGNNVIAFTGTSGAAPGVVGTMAAVASLNPDLAPIEVANLVLGNSNEASAAGRDVFTGNGVVATDRVIYLGDTARSDLAVAGFFYDPRTSVLQTTFENRGNTPANNVGASFSLNGGVRDFEIPFLGAGETHTFEQFIAPDLLRGPTGVRTSATIDGGANDARLDNNGQSAQFQLGE